MMSLKSNANIITQKRAPYYYTDIDKPASDTRLDVTANANDLVKTAPEQPKDLTVTPSTESLLNVKPNQQPETKTDMVTTGTEMVDTEEQNDEKVLHEVDEQVKALPEAEKMGFWKGVAALGFRGEILKNKIFSRVFGSIAGKGDGTGEPSMSKRFFSSLRDINERNLKLAEKNLQDLQEGNEQMLQVKGLNIVDINKLKGTGHLLGHAAKILGTPVRVISTVSIGLEAAKEARFKSEDVIDKTRINDVDQAADEAWKIYEEAQSKAGEDDVVSKENLDRAYQQNLPKDLLARLSKDPEPGVANGILEKFVRWDMKRSISKIDKKLSAMDADQSLTSDQKEANKQKYLNNWFTRSQRIKDFDRMVGQNGEIDMLASAAKYGELAAKTATIGAMSKSILSVPTQLAEYASKSDGLSIDIIREAQGADKPPESATPPDTLANEVPGRHMDNLPRTGDTTPNILKPGGGAGEGTGITRGNEVTREHIDNLSDTDDKTPNKLKVGGSAGEGVHHVVEAVNVEKNDTLTSIFKKGLLGGLNDDQQENVVQNLLYPEKSFDSETALKVREILREAGIKDPGHIEPGQKIPLDKINAALGDKLQALREHAQSLGAQHETPVNVTTENIKAAETPKAADTSHIDRGNQVPRVPTENTPGFHKSEIPNILKAPETHQAGGQTVELRSETPSAEGQPDNLKVSPSADTQTDISHINKDNQVSVDPTENTPGYTKTEVPNILDTPKPEYPNILDGPKTEVPNILKAPPVVVEDAQKPAEAATETTIPQTETATQEKVEQQEVAVETTQTEEVAQEKVKPQETPAETPPEEEVAQKYNEIKELLGKHTPEIFSQQKVDVPKNHDIKVVGEAKGTNIENNGDIEHVKMKSEAVKETVETIVPQSWLKSMNSIQFVSHDFELIEAYGMPGVKSAATSDGAGNIVFYAEASMLNMRTNIGENLIHEITHENDWERSDILNPDERVNLLSQVLERVQSEDRFRSSYVETIHNTDKQLELKMKAGEYWAEISAAYFGGDPNLSYEDSRIVEDYIKKDNPKFNVEEARAKINALGSNSEKGHAQG